jgi:hypothetical protein
MGVAIVVILKKSRQRTTHMPKNNVFTLDFLYTTIELVKPNTIHPNNTLLSRG